MRLIEGAIFIAAATGLHALAFWSYDSQAGGKTTGDLGDATVSVFLESSELAALVKEWDTPPEAMPASVQPDAPTVPDAAAPVSSTIAALSRSTAPDRPQAASQDALQGLDTRLPAPATLTDATPTQPNLPAVLPAPAQVAGLTSNRQAQTPVPLAPPTTDDAMDVQTPPQPDDGTVYVSQRPQLRPADLKIPAPQPKKTAKAKPAAQPTPKKKASAPSAPAVKQVQKGAKAKTVNTGAAVKQKSAGLSKGQAAKLQAQWGNKIRSAVARAQRMPRGVKGKSTVLIRLSVTPSGKLASVGIGKSSGNAAIDQAALKAARAARLPRAPKGLSAQSYSFNLPLNFVQR